MAADDARVVRRLLRHAFSEILSLTDRLTAVEQRNDPPRNTAVRKNVELSGTVDLTAGAVVRSGRREEVPTPSIALGPLVQAKLKCPLPFPRTQSETTFATSTPGTRLELKKVLFRGDWFKNCLKFVCCPVGGSGPDIIPTLNPNADEGLSQVITSGCPVHQECANAASIGGSFTKKGNMFATGLFHQNHRGSMERLISLTQGILSPTENLTFGIFAAHAFARSVRESVGSCSTDSQPTFGMFGPLMQHHAHGRFSSYDSRRSPWVTESVKIGSVGAWNVDDEYVLSGWWSIKNAKYRFRETMFDSCGVAVSTFPYANTPTHKLGFQVKHTADGNIYSMECSSKHTTEQGLDVHPGLVLDFSSRGISALFGIKTLLKF